MNLGIKHANGKYLYFLNSDDFLEPNIFKHFLEYSYSDADIYYGELKTLKIV